MIDERSSSSILRKMISEPQTGIEPTTLCHQKVTGSIPVCGTEIVFLRIELDEVRLSDRNKASDLAGIL